MSSAENNIHKDQIEVGIHKISCNADNYGYENDGHVDGIHMYGPKGSEGYTKSLMAILSDKLNIQPGGINFPPARRIVKRKSNPPAKTNLKENSSNPESRPNNPSLFHFAVKTFNRFSTLLN